MKSVFSITRLVAEKRTGFALIIALVLGLGALALRLWSPDVVWLDSSVQLSLHALSLIMIALVISGKYRRERQSHREEAARDRQLQAMLSMFMVVKHELHNDMQVVMGNAELASMMLESGGAARKPVENINEAAALAIDRIQQLSVFSASMQSAPAAVDINALLRETTARLTSELPPRVELKLELEPLQTRILADRNLLSLSLSYLIRLAVKTLAQGGEIVVRTRSATDGHMRNGLIMATTEIVVVRRGKPDDLPSQAAQNKQHDKFERVLAEARNTTQALVERSGAYVLVGPFAPGSESLIKIGFLAANVTSSLKESVVIDEF